MRTLRAILKTAAKLVLGRGVQKSYAQFGEDMVAAWLLRGRRGTYVDVGAYHPTLYSNTYAFYRKGWRGVVVDPNPELAPLFAVFRPRDTFVNTAVGTQAGTLTYYAYADGAYNSLDPARVEALKAEKGITPVRTMPVSVQSLTQIVRDAHLSCIDFLSVDVEGMDQQVLESYDWHVRPRVVCIEAHGFDPATPQSHPLFQLLTTQGYALRAVAGLSLLFSDTK